MDPQSENRDGMYSVWNIGSGIMSENFKDTSNVSRSISKNSE